MREVLRPGGPGFAEACAVFNVGVQVEPALIVRCADASDVQAAIAHARTEGLPLTVRGGGHAVGGFCLARGGVVIDVRPMRALSVSGDTVTAGAGCGWGDLPVDTHASVGAFDPRVGVAGFVLGGGYGMLTRLHGLGSDHLLAAEVVLADGSCVTADADLLWALRGAGPNFGVVTQLTLRRHPLRPLTVAKVVYPLSRLRELLRLYRDTVAGLTDATTVYFGIQCTRTGFEGVQLLGFHFGEDASPLAALRTWGRPLHEEQHAVGYAAAHVANEQTFPAGHHHAWRAHFLPSLSDAVVDRLAVLASGGHELWAVLEHLGGAMGRPAPGATAFAHRAARFGFVSAVKWKGTRPAATLRAQDALHAALQPESIGTYVNYLGARPTNSDIAAAYGANLPRLSELKRRYDPHNVFRHNVNIRPS